MLPGVSGMAPGILPFFEGSIGVGALSAIEEAIAGFGLIGGARLGGALGGGPVGFAGVEFVAGILLLCAEAALGVEEFSC